MPGPEAPAELSQPAVDRMVADALAAFAAAGSSAELKAARLAHTGEKSPLALANRAIGALPGVERKDAGQRLGLARAAVQEQLAARSEELGAAELAEQLVAERIDVTLPVENGRAVAHAMGSRATLLELPELGHHDVLVAPAVQEAVRVFISQHTAGSQSATSEQGERIGQ